MNDRGLIIILSGFSGSGKGTVMKRILEKYPDEYALSISATTRDPRPEDEEGVTYFFKSRDEFEEMISKGELLEYAQYVGNYYGTPMHYVEEKLSRGINVFLEIEVQGALKVKERFPDTMMIFLVPPNAAELKKRLMGRQTEPEDVVNSRLAKAYEESAYIDRYDYMVVNDEVESCVEAIHTITTGASCRVDRCGDMIEQFKKELKEFTTGDTPD
ncbi:MAG: guanylate kinase [Eubacterium sp.]|nr:guanylate kinase [Eubacterium sp.]